MSDNFEYTFLSGIVSTQDLTDISRLYHQENWFANFKNVEDFKNIITGSFCFLVVRKNNKIIGTGRVLSDGVSDAYIHNVVVAKEYRGQQIGKEIIQHMIDFCLFHHISWIGLIAEPGTESFYKKSGFQLMKDHYPMVLRI